MKKLILSLCTLTTLFCTPQMVDNDSHVVATNNTYEFMTAGVSREVHNPIPADTIINFEVVEEQVVSEPAVDVNDNIEPMSCEPVITSTVCDVPVSGCFKSWMTWDVNDKNRFNTDSNQYKLQLKAETGKYGIRTVDKRFCVAVGSGYSSTIGQYIDVVLENGTVLECIVADQKADEHTDDTNRYHRIDGSVVEFIVDSEDLNSDARYHGDMSWADESLSGAIREIIVYDEYASY